MKRIVTITAFMFFMLQMSGAAVAQDRTIIYAFDKDYPPFTFVENGKPTGFDIEILAAALQDRNVSMVYKSMSWGDVQESLKQGKVHVTSGMANSEDRRKIFDFSYRPYADLKMSLFTTQKSNIRTLKDLKDKRVTAQKDSLYQKLLEQKGFRPALYDTESEALLAVFREKADAFAGNEKTALFNIRKYNLRGLFPVSTPLEISSLYYAVKKGDRSLLGLIDEGMQKIRQDGTYDRIYRKWFVEELTQDEIKRMLEKAREAAFSAYAPYSNIAVGAAVLTSSGRIYTGCNIENAILGYTVTAMKVALCKAVSEGETHFKAVLNLFPRDRIGAPAPDERQIIAEFNKGTLVVIDDGTGNHQHLMISQLIPFPFERE